MTWKATQTQVVIITKKGLMKCLIQVLTEYNDTYGVNFSVWKNSVRDKELFALGNVFKTSAEAKKLATKYVDFLDGMEPIERWRA